MDVYFEDDISMIITAIENGDIEDALQMLREIRDEQADPARAAINPN